MKIKKYPEGGQVPSFEAPDQTPPDYVKKYGKYVKGREAWIGWTDKKLGDKTIKEMVMSAAKNTGIDPALLYASAMEEGMNLRIKQPEYVSQSYMAEVDKKTAKAFPVDGFYNYGLDTFSDQFETLVKKGYLKEDFKSRFSPYRGLNEKKQWVNTAAFIDDGAALEAKAAMIALTRDQVSGYAKKKKINLDQQARDFFTLAAYNGGIGNAQGMLDSWNRQGLLKNNSFLKKKPSDYEGIYDNVMKRVQGSSMLKGEGRFAWGGMYQFTNENLPELNAFNFGLSKLHQGLQGKEDREYQEQQILLQNQHDPIRPSGQQQYGSPYVYDRGGIIPDDLSYMAPLPDISMPMAPSGPQVAPAPSLDTVPSPTLSSSSSLSSSRPSFEVPDIEDADTRMRIIQKESDGNYKALPRKKDGSLASSAVGAYQFLWNTHKDSISKITGVKTKEEFRNNPGAQDQYYAYWDKSVLTPTAIQIKKLFPHLSLGAIKLKIHFAGAKGAMDYFTKGKETVDAFGTKTSTYRDGGEYQMDEQEIQRLRSLGYNIEEID